VHVNQRTPRLYAGCDLLAEGAYVVLSIVGHYERGSRRKRERFQKPRVAAVANDPRFSHQNITTLG